MSDAAPKPTEIVPRPAEGPRPRSAPAAGRAFTTEACRWNAAVLQAEELVRRGLASVAPSQRLGEAAAVHSRARQMSRIHRASRRLVASWLAAVLVDDLDAGASLLDAEHWFTGAATTAARLPLDSARHAQDVLEALASWDGALEMLPYALDPIPHEYRRDVLQDEGAGAARVARKERGSFFTPTDVADHIIRMALANVDVHSSDFRLLDPAAGTGVFLRSAFRALLQREVTPDRAIAALHGIDLDECCVEMGAFVLLVDYRRAATTRTSGPAFGMWSQIRHRLLAADTLLVLDGVGGATTLFGACSGAPKWLGEPFDTIVGNPPYARLGSRSDLGDLAGRYRSLEGATAATDVYPAFLELLCSRLRPRGAGSMVVPMSIGYSNTRSLRRLRQTAVAVGGEWTFEFFDRTPDALFGDDVKQRTAVVTRIASDSDTMVTGPVMRWTSRNRAKLFARLPRVDLGTLDFSRGVPKLGSTGQAEIYAALRARPPSFGREALSRRRVIPPVADDDDETTVYVAGTAYNWLNVYRQGAAIASEVQSPTTSPLLALTFQSGSQADAVFAMLSSRLTFWLWRVESDAFHVPSGWVTGLPLALGAVSAAVVNRLAAQGRALWAAVVQHPIVSVNGGRTTLSYCPHAQPELLDAIDAEILCALGLPASFRAELSAFVRDLTAAGRGSASEHGLRRALASWRED